MAKRRAKAKSKPAHDRMTEGSIYAVDGVVTHVGEPETSIKVGDRVDIGSLLYDDSEAARAARRENAKRNPLSLPPTDFDTPDHPDDVAEPGARIAADAAEATARQAAACVLKLGDLESRGGHSPVDPMTPTRLRECLDALCWSQRGLARILNRSEGAVRAWARGTEPIPPGVAAWLEERGRHAERAPPPPRNGR